MPRAGCVGVLGCSSVGERDLILDVITAKGEMLFHGIAVKPGKPTAFGRINDKLVFGMPGISLVVFVERPHLAGPALRRIARLPEQIVRSLTLPLASRVTSVPGRHQFYTVRIENGLAVPAFKASGDITSMSKADGFIEIPADVEVVQANELVEVRLF
jgi:molybdopterin biosynthesis enzyme